MSTKERAEFLGMVVPRSSDQLRAGDDAIAANAIRVALLIDQAHHRINAEVQTYNEALDAAAALYHARIDGLYAQPVPAPVEGLVATMIEDPASQAHQAIVDVAGAVYDPATAGLLAGPSVTRDALDAAIKPGPARHPVTGWYHAAGYGAAGDETGNDQPAIQAAIDDAEAAGGGVVYLPDRYRIAAGLLLPSNVQLRGNNAGAQPGPAGARSRIVYAGPSGGAVISPKVRTGNTINWGISGLRIDGGALAGVLVDAYRVSYSRFTDLALYGALAGDGVGFIFDADVIGQCYFNVADGVKVDGLPTGVRFTRGANANRWLGGKIGNGGVGLEFLSLSAGNLVQATDLEEATSMHVRIDAPANVFEALHMERAPIGYNITANGSGTRRLATTFAATVLTYLVDASTLGGGIDEVTPDTYGLRVGSTRLQSKTVTGSTQVTLDPAPFSGSASVLVNVLRNVATTGLRQLNVYKGDGSPARALGLDAGTATLSIGDVGVGGLAGGLGIANRATAPATNPAAGGVIYVEAGALKFKGSAGTVTTIAPA